jgi:NAD(P)-dependent dehydrogenase (short-subunit alcohol dehydrogenase family)
MIPGADVRIIYTSSTAWRGGSLHFDKLRTTQESVVLGRWVRYGSSKLANVLYARELSEPYPKIISFSVTPGITSTGLVTDLKTADRLLVWVGQFDKIYTPEEGSFNHLWAVSTLQDSIKPGAFYEPVGELSSISNASTKDPKVGKQLWEWTAKELDKRTK